MSSKRDEAAISAAISAPEEPRPLVPQRHGGALLRGGVRGHDGRRAGRPPSAVREAARLGFDERIALLERIADGVATTVRRDADGREHTVVQSVPIRDRISAIAELGRIGMGPTVSADDIQLRLIEQATVLRAILDPTTCERVLAALGDVWK